MSKLKRPCRDPQVRPPSNFPTRPGATDRIRKGFDPSLLPDGYVWLATNQRHLFLLGCFHFLAVSSVLNPRRRPRCLSYSDLNRPHIFTLLFVSSLVKLFLTCLKSRCRFNLCDKHLSCWLVQSRVNFILFKYRLLSILQAMPGQAVP